MAFKHRSAQIVKLLPTGLALILLAISLVGMKPTLVDVTRLAVWATNPI